MTSSDTQISFMTKRVTYWTKLVGLIGGILVILGVIWTVIGVPQVRDVIETEMDKEHDGLNVRNESTMRAVAQEEASRIMEQNIPRITKIASDEAEDVGVAVWDRTEDDLQEIKEDVREVKENIRESNREQRRVIEKLDVLIANSGGSG